jgi:hypothetical protein
VGIRLKTTLATVVGIVTIWMITGCMGLPPTPHSGRANLLTESEIVARLDNLCGVASVETSIQPVGFTRFAIVTIYLETDSVEYISALQDYSAKLLYLNSTFRTPGALVQTFRWARAFGIGAANQAPRAQILDAVKAKTGVEVTENAPGTAVRLVIDSSTFDGGLRASQIDVDDVPAILKSPPPPVTTSPTPEP